MESVLRNDMVHSASIGAVIGVTLAVSILVLAYSLGFTNSAAGWIPFVFLSIVILGFCTWEGGLIGIHNPHYQFARFEETLSQGNHVFFVDIEEQQESALTKVMHSHPRLQLAGMGDATPAWVIKTQDNYKAFVRYMP